MDMEGIPGRKGKEIFQLQVGTKGSAACPALSWEEKLLVPIPAAYQELTGGTEGAAESVVRTQQTGRLDGSVS